MTRQSKAWLLRFGEGCQAAIGERELVHVVYLPTFVRIPQAPLHCRYLLLWEKRYLPVWDMLSWLDGRPRAVNTAIAAIVAHRTDGSDGIEFGAFPLIEVPHRLSVSDPDDGVVPTLVAPWSEIALSAFADQSETIPVLDLAGMFANRLAERVLA